ncbi:MAG: cephalosporin hydroxylase [Phycisphaerales bacterium]|nr:cephalosporin hydroxylase [Phycisphaerales bacterium]
MNPTIRPLHALPNLSDDEQRIVDQFHALYYNKRLWATTKWLGAACLKSPTDTWVYQEILFETRPTLIIETGTAWGGSAHYLGTVLDAISLRDPAYVARIVTIDTETRDGEADHPRVTKIKASSLAPETIAQVRGTIRPTDRVMLILDSLHNRDHVLAELHAYAHLVTPGCYAIVEDGDINGHPVHTDFAPDQGPGPLEAVTDYLATTDRFEIDRAREKLLLSLNPCGYLRCVRP